MFSVSKPGDCPAGATLPETCSDTADECAGDEDCPDELKCCFDGCIVTCVEPLGRDEHHNRLK